MTLDDVKARIAEIESHIDDDEVAHVIEDQLYHDLLVAISTGECKDVVNCIKEALKTKDLNFARWCA